MTQQHTDAKARPKDDTAHKEEEKVKIEGEGGSIEVERDDVISRLDEIAEAILPEQEPPKERAPTDENS